MEINIKKYLEEGRENEFMYGAVLACTGDYVANGGDAHNIVDERYNTTGIIDVELKLNGVEVNPVEFFELMDRTLKTREENLVKKLSLTSLNEKFDLMQEMLKEVQSFTSNLFEMNDRLTNEFNKIK